jgi:hypothetical protein
MSTERYPGAITNYCGDWRAARDKCIDMQQGGTRLCTMLFFTIALASRCNCLSAGVFFATPAPT